MATTTTKRVTPNPDDINATKRVLTQGATGGTTVSLTIDTWGGSWGGFGGTLGLTWGKTWFGVSESIASSGAKPEGTPTKRVTADAIASHTKRVTDAVS